MRSTKYDTAICAGLTIPSKDQCRLQTFPKELQIKSSNNPFRDINACSIIKKSWKQNNVMDLCIHSINYSSSDNLGI